MSEWGSSNHLSMSSHISKEICKDLISMLFYYMSELFFLNIWSFQLGDITIGTASYIFYSNFHARSDKCNGNQIRFCTFTNCKKQRPSFVNEIALYRMFSIQWRIDFIQSLIGALFRLPCQAYRSCVTEAIQWECMVAVSLRWHQLIHTAMLCGYEFLSLPPIVAINHQPSICNLSWQQPYCNHTGPAKLLLQSDTNSDILLSDHDKFVVALWQLTPDWIKKLT